jgi:DNA-directed RNA polymerase beta subunit
VPEVSLSVTRPPEQLSADREGKIEMRNGNHAVRERERLDFSKIKSSIQIPNLIEVQRMSYQRFLQMDLLPSEREDTGLQSVFSSVFPIQDFRGLIIPSGIGSASAAT